MTKPIRLRQPAWEADSTGIRPGGDADGDIQVGEAFAVRYRRPDVPLAMITQTAYPAEDERWPGEFFVQVQTEWLAFTDEADPGGSKTWSDYGYDDEPETYVSADEAEEAARQVAIQLLGDGGSHSWDGIPGHYHEIQRF